MTRQTKVDRIFSVLNLTGGFQDWPSTETLALAERIADALSPVKR